MVAVVTVQGTVCQAALDFNKHKMYSTLYNICTYDAMYSKMADYQMLTDSLSLEGFLSVNHVVEFSMSKAFRPQKGLQLQ